MNMRADTSRPSPVASIAAVATPVAPAALVPIADAVCAVVFDTAATRPGDRPRLTALLDGELLSRPMISTSLELRSGQRRHVLLLGRGADELLGRRLSLALGPRIVATIDPNWLQPPLADGSALTDGLSETGRRRLLKLFLTTGASLFGLGETSAFGAAASSFFELMGVRTGEFASWCPLGDAGHILSFRMPIAPEACVIGELIALAADRIHRVGGFWQHVESTKRGTYLHLFLPRGFAPGSAMVGLGDTPVLLPAPGEDALPRPIAPWLACCEDTTRRWAHELIAEVAAADAGAAVLMREIRHGADAAATVAVRHLSATLTGVLLSVEVTDRHDLALALRVERGAEFRDIPLAGAGWGSAHLVRFVDLPRAHWLEDTCRLRLVYRSGRLQTVAEGPLSPLTAALPDGFDATAEDAAAIAAARLSLEPKSIARKVEAFGDASVEPRLSLVVAVGDNLDLIRIRAALLFHEPGAAAVELLYHAPHGPLAAAARRAIASTHAVYGMPHRLVTVPEDATPTERLVTASSMARADAVFVLGADVLPLGAGWLAGLRRVIGNPRSARIVGATLIAADGAVLDAGGTVPPGTARIERRFVGLPAADLPPVASLPTDLVNSDCVGLTRSAVDILTAFTGPYPNPDIVLAEAAFRLRADGSPVRTHLRNRFVRYRDAPAPGALEAAIDGEALRLRLNEIGGTA